MNFSGLQILASDVPRNGAEQMAADDFLLRSAAVPVLRFYTWSDRHQATCGYSHDLNEVSRAHPGWQWTRRRTGGGLVFHDRDCTLALVLPGGRIAGGIGEFYRLFHTALARCLSECGVPCRLAHAPASPHAGNACFQAPVPHDLLDANGAKLAGGALRRTRHTLLYQGSVHVPPDLLLQFQSSLPGILSPDWSTHPGFSETDEETIRSLLPLFPGHKTEGFLVSESENF